MFPKRNEYYLQRKKKKITTSTKLFLERTLGFTLNKPTAFALCARDNLIAYPSGCVVTLFDYHKGKQVGFLVAPLVIDSANKNVITNKNISDSTTSLNSNSNLSSSNNGVIPKTISCLSFSPSGSYLAVGEVGHNPRVLVWNYKTKEVLAELRDHKFGVQAVVFSFSNPFTLISIGNQNDGYANVWDWKSKKIEACNKITSKVNSVAFSPDGNFFVTVGLRHVKFWSIRTKNGRKVLEGQAAQLHQHRDKNFVDVVCQVNPKTGLVRTYVISDNCTLIWFESDNTWEGYVHLKANYAYSIAASDNLLVVGCSNGIVRFYDPVKNSIVFTAPRPHPLGVDISVNNGTSYSSASNENNVYPCTIALSVDPKNNNLACVYSDCSIYIWNTENFEEPKKRASFLYHSDSIWGVEVYPLSMAGMSITQRGIITKLSKNKPAFPPNTFFTYSSDGTVRFWNLDHMTHSQTFASFIASPTREEFNIPGSNDSPISISPLPSQSDNIKKSIYTRQALKILYVDPEYIKMLKSEIRGMDNATCGVRSACVSGNGKYLATGDRLGNIRIYDLEDQYKNIIYAEVHNSEVLSLDFSIPSFDENMEDEKLYLISSSRDRLIHLFELKDEKLKFLTSLDDHSASISTVRFSNKENKVVSCSADKSIIFRNKEENKNTNNNGSTISYTKFNTISVRSTIYDFDVDSNKDKVISVSQDKKITEYDIKSGKVISSWACTDPSDNECSIINNTKIDCGLIKIALDPTGKYAAICSMDKCIRLFDLETKKCISRGFGHSELITGVHFTMDGKRLISTSTDGCIFVWRLDPIIVKDIKNRLSKKVGVVWPTSIMSEDYVKTPVKIKFDVNYDELPRWAKEQIDLEESNGNTSSGNDDSLNNTNNKSNEDSNIKDNNSNNINNIPKIVIDVDVNNNKDGMSKRSANSKSGSLIKNVWEKRISPDGVPLFSEFPNYKPIAKLVDRNERRYSIETITYINSPKSLSFPVPLQNDLTGEGNNQNLVIEDDDEDDFESSQSEIDDETLVVDKNDLEAVKVSDEALKVNTPNKNDDSRIGSLSGSKSNSKERSLKAKSASQLSLRIDTSFNRLDNLSCSNLRDEVSIGNLSRMARNNENISNENLDASNNEKEDGNNKFSKLLSHRLNYGDITFEEYLNQPVPPTPLRLSITSQFWESRNPNLNSNNSIINKPRGIALNVDTLIDNEELFLGFENDEFYNSFKKENDEKNHRQLQFKRLLMAQEIEKTKMRLSSISNTDSRKMQSTKDNQNQLQTNKTVNNTQINKNNNNNNNKNNNTIINSKDNRKNDNDVKVKQNAISSTNNAIIRKISENVKNQDGNSTNNYYSKKVLQNKAETEENKNIFKSINITSKLISTISNSQDLSSKNEKIKRNVNNINNSNNNNHRDSHDNSKNNNINNSNTINNRSNNNSNNHKSSSNNNNSHNSSSNNNSSHNSSSNNNSSHNSSSINNSSHNNSSTNRNNHNSSSSSNTKNNSNNISNNNNKYNNNNNNNNNKCNVIINNNNNNNSNNKNNNGSNNNNCSSNKSNNIDNYNNNNIINSNNSNNNNSNKNNINSINSNNVNNKINVINGNNTNKSNNNNSSNNSNNKNQVTDKIRKEINNYGTNISNDSQKISSGKGKEIDEKKIRTQLQVLQNITNELADTLKYLQSNERKASVDLAKHNQDQQLIHDISKTINNLMSKVGASLNLTSINDVKPYVQMLNNALNNSN